MKTLHLSIITITAIGVLVGMTLTSGFGDQPEWKKSTAATRFSNTQPTQIFNIQYRLFNGTVDTFNEYDYTFTINTNSKNDGIFEIKIPRNYPYYVGRGEGSSIKEPYLVIENTVQLNPTEYSKTNSDCFFTYSIPFYGNSTITVLSDASRFLITPLYGDNVPDHCISETIAFTSNSNCCVEPQIAVSDAPLKQFKSGVAANNIICRSDHQLLVHQKEKRPICVNPLSVTNLIKRGWEIPTHCDYKINFTYDLLGEVVIEKNASNQNSGKSYHPITGTVIIGFNNTMEWDNVDDIPSSVTSDWGLFDSGLILPDHYWRHNFECIGTYGYHSEPHPWMHGWITVLPPSRLK